MICSSSTCSSLSRIFRVISDLSFSPIVTCFTPNGVHCSPGDASPSSSPLAQAVAYAAHGLNQAGVGRVLFQLLTQPAHMHVHGSCISCVVVAPDIVQQLVTRQDRATVTHKVGEQLELLRLQFDFLASTIDTTPGQVDAQWTGHQLAIGPWYFAPCILCGLFSLS